MTLNAFLSGANAVCYEKEGNKYGMCCAWAQMIDYDKISMLLGQASVTGQNIKKGDIIGVSSLAKGQKNVALQLGENHSNEIDKFKNISYTKKDSAILINDSKVKMICKVIDVLHLDCIKEDHFLILEVKEYETDEKKDFLSLKEVFSKDF